MIWRFWLSLVVFTLSVAAFDLGQTPTYYKKGDKVELLVNKVESDNTQLPYRYYELPFVCPPRKGLKAKPLSIGQILNGDRIWESGYDLKFGIDQPCLRLCDLIAKETGLKRAESLIRDGYVTHWLLDGLPGATTFVSSNKNNKYYAAGFPLGFVEDDVSYIYNHFMLVIRYHANKKSRKMNTIVGFEVYPKSVSNEQCPGSSKDYKNFALVFKKNDKGDILPHKTTIPYTYSVYWREDNSIDYDHRWDLYYENESNGNHSIRWMAFINSVVLLSLLSMVVFVVFVRVLRSDLVSSQSLPTTEQDVGDNSRAWRKYIDDVNTKPSMALLLTLLVSSGIQIILAANGVVFIFVINSSKNGEGAFISLLLFFFIISGFVSSYSGIVLHKLFNNDDINTPYNKKTYVTLSLLFSGFLPTLIFSVSFTLNLFVWAKASSYALPFGTILVLVCLVLLVQLPLGLVGGYYGNKKQFQIGTIPGFSEKSSNTHSSKKSFQPHVEQKKKSWLLSPIPSTLIFGLVPFGIVYVELLFIFNSIWLEKTTFYYMYGFLLITSLILMIVIAEMAIIATYISLSIYNNPHWHWLCFRVGSSIGFFIFGYSIHYFTLYLHIRDFVSVLFYFAYMALVCIISGIGGGSVAVLSGFIFIRLIYGGSKVD